MTPGRYYKNMTGDVLDSPKMDAYDVRLNGTKDEYILRL